MHSSNFLNFKVADDFEASKSSRNIPVANRWGGDLADVADKVYTRDLFGRD